MPRLTAGEIVEACACGGRLYHGTFKGKWRYWIVTKQGAIYSTSFEAAQRAIRSRLIVPAKDALIDNVNQTWVAVMFQKG